MIRDFIVDKERKLFQCRLEQYSRNSYLLKNACKRVLKDVHSLLSYQELNPVTGTKELPHNGTMLLATLSCVCKLLVRDEIDRHFRLDCRQGCNAIEIEGTYSLNSPQVLTFYPSLVSTAEKLYSSFSDVFISNEFAFG